MKILFIEPQEADLTPLQAWAVTFWFSSANGKVPSEATGWTGCELGIFPSTLPVGPSQAVCIHQQKDTTVLREPASRI